MAGVQLFNTPPNNPFHRIQDGSSSPTAALSGPPPLFDHSDRAPLFSSFSSGEKTLVGESDSDISDISPTSSNSELPPDSPLPSPDFLPKITPKSITPSRFSRFSLSERAFEETEPYLIGAGLLNLGNTCFLNAVLQCITHTVPVINGIRSSTHKFPCQRSNDGFCVLCVLHEHIELALSSSGSVISPEKFVDNMSNISSILQRYHQEDAHEFLQCFLDKLDSCFSVSQSAAENDNFVKRVFGGRLISKLRCCNCDRSSECYEPIIDLSLEIKDVDSLPCALESFTTVEKIGEPETRFTCENCKEVVTAEKQFLLDEVPSVATFHLKRFTSEGFRENNPFLCNDIHFEKIDKLVDYPLELDLQPFTNCSNSDNLELKYMLYAVVVHAGRSSNSGHYYCYIRSSPDIWYLLDDTEVTRVTEDVALTQEAYILFYAKQGTPWFSSLKKNEKPHPPSPNTLSTSPNSVLANFENISALSPDADPITDDSLGNEVEDPNKKDSINASMLNEVEDSVPALLAPSPTMDVPMANEVEDSVSSKPTTSGKGNAREEDPTIDKFEMLTPPSSPEQDYISPMLLGSLAKGGLETPRVKIEEQEKSGRGWSDEVDWKKRAAAKTVRGGFTGGRRAKLIAALMESQGEGSMKKKSKGMDGAYHARRRSCPGH